MPTSPGSLVTAAQLALAATPRRSPLLDAFGAARSPADITAAVRAAREPTSATIFEGLGHHPAELRATHAAALGLSADDLAYRALFPGLDIGVYACSHSMGVPSVAGPAAVIDQLAQLARDGIGVWDDGLWSEVMDAYRARCAELVGGSLSGGDVTWFPNVSEALSAVLECFDGGTLVYTAGHFTTGHYVHHQWAKTSGGTLREVPVDPDGSVPTERLLAAIDSSVRVVSISHALFESGWLQDLPTIAAAVRERAPNALLLVDAYQTAGTVPIDAAALGDHVAVTAGGHKQLRSSAGATFLYLPTRWLAALEPRRTGWWNHAAPFAFEKGPVRRGTDGSRFRTGTPTMAGMAMLLGELATLASSANGSITGGVQRARRVTSTLVGHLLARARELDLPVRGDWGPERRAAFVVIRVDGGKHVNEALAAEGFRVDFRPLRGGSEDGYLRVGTSGVGFAYEFDAVMDAIARHRR